MQGFNISKQKRQIGFTFLVFKKKLTFLETDTSNGNGKGQNGNGKGQMSHPFCPLPLPLSVMVTGQDSNGTGQNIIRGVSRIFERGGPISLCSLKKGHQILKGGVQWSEGGGSSTFDPLGRQILHI